MEESGGYPYGYENDQSISGCRRLCHADAVEEEKEALRAGLSGRPHSGRPGVHGARI